MSNPQKTLEHTIKVLSERHRQLDSLIKEEEKSKIIPQEVISEHKRIKLSLKTQLTSLQH
jgi:hypothetical protein